MADDKATTAARVFGKYASQYVVKFRHYEPYIETYQRFASYLKENDRVLDVACGPGIVGRVLLQQIPNLQINGIDLSPDMIELAQASVPAGTFQVQDCRDLSGIEGKFDAIISSFFFPYLSREEVTTFIEYTKNLLDTDGLLYVSTMEGDYEDSGYQSNNADDQIYTHYYSLEFLNDVLEENGFTVIHTERKVFELDQDEGNDKASETTDLFIFARLS